MKVDFKVLDVTKATIKTVISKKAKYKTSKVVYHQTGSTSTKEEAFRSMVEKVSKLGATAIFESAAAKFAMMSDETSLLVSMRKGNFIFLNKGRNGDVIVGEEYELLQSHGTLRDPRTGKVIGVAEVPLGRIRIIQVNQRNSIAKPIGQLLDTAKEGDVVRKVSGH
ncbi:MAG: hypothetical protein HQL71_14325 [Magnetococcales bacterium]|nr:hypothetical protein [Magnetococcales bacterium]